jgi:hypothetical protein
VQAGTEPVFAGTGSGDLRCECGQSVLVRGYLPANFLSIRIQCARCSAVTVTPRLPEGEILRRTAIAVGANATASVKPYAIGPETVLAGQDAMARCFALTCPREPPSGPILLSRELVEATAAGYDRLTGGRLAEHAAASPPAMEAEQGPYPFAWSVLRLREQIGRPGWSWLHHNDDAMAAMHVAAMHELLQTWQHHALLERLAAVLAAPGKFLRTVAAFATAKKLFDDGNRVGFDLPAQAGTDVELHFTTPADDPMTLALLAPAPLQWPERDRRNPRVLRAAVTDAMTSVQGRVNRNRPGIVVLLTSILLPDFDQMLVDTIQLSFQSVGRKNRGVAAVAAVVPKVVPTEHLDHLGFGFAYYPLLNPHFDGENPIRLTPAPGIAGTTMH